MTDKTDIKALRDKHALALKDLTERLTECNRLNYCWDEMTAFEAFSSTVIDQLEAERQRADEMRVGLESEISHSNRCIAKINTLEAELAELRGTQEPVAVVERSDYITTAEIRGDIPRRKAVRELYEGSLVIGQELFTHPPKPVVVLPKRHFGAVQDGHAVMIPYSGGHWLNKTAVIETLEAAGIVVKDGE